MMQGAQKNYFLNRSDTIKHFFPHIELLRSPSADSKFVLSILKFFKHAQFFMYTQNHFGTLKS